MKRKQLKTICQRMSITIKQSKVKTLRKKTRLLSLVVCAVVLLTSVSTTFAWFGSSYENLETVVSMGKYSADISVYSENGELIENKTAENGDKISFDYENNMSGWSAGDVSAYYIYADNTGEIDIKAYLSFESAFMTSDENDTNDYTYAKKHFSYLVKEITDAAADNGGFTAFIQNNKLPSAEEIAKEGNTFADDSKGAFAGEIKAGKNACYALYFCCYDIPEALLSDKYSFEFNTSVITTQAGAPTVQETTGDLTEPETSTDAPETTVAPTAEPTEAVSTTAQTTANTQPVPKADWEWKYNNASHSSVTLTKYNGSSKSVVVPALADGVIVTGMADNMFADTAVEKAEIPASIVTFGKNAFDGGKLYNISIQAKTSINGKVYNSPYYTDGKVIYTADKTALVKYMPYNMDTTFTVPAAVTAIYENAFYGCSNLKTIIMNNVDYITASTFAGSSIKDYYLCSDNVVQTVGNRVFGSTSGTTIHVLQSMGNAYSSAKSLKAYKVVNDIAINYYENYPYAVINGIKYVIMSNGAEFYGTKYKSSNSEFVVIAGYESIPDNGVLIVPETVVCDNKVYNVVAVAENAFKGCSELKQVVLPSHKVTYAESSFANCKNLGSIQYNNIIKYSAENSAD